MHRAVKVVLVVAGALLALVLAAGILVGNFLFELALMPQSDKSVVMEAEQNQMDYESFDQDEWEEARDWLREHSGYTDTYITSEDGLRLRALRIDNPDAADRWFVVCHGYGSSAGSMAAPAKRFYDMGYSVLVPEARGHGHSEGSYYGMGWHDRLDLVAWTRELAAWQPECGIGLYGVSMGGATVMMAAGEDLPANVKVIVEDCGYTSIREEFSHQLKGIFGLPSFPVLDFASLVTWVRAGFWLGEGDAVAQVAKATTPMLFIHGDADTFVPAYMLDVVYEAATVEKERMLVEGAGHGLAATVAGDAYWNAVEAFAGRYIA